MKRLCLILFLVSGGVAVAQTIPSDDQLKISCDRWYLWHDAGGVRHCTSNPPPSNPGVVVISSPPRGG